MPLSKEKKTAYIARVQNILSTYKKFFVVTVENVGSKAMQTTRMQMRGKAEILMGKKSLLRKALSISSYIFRACGLPRLLRRFGIKYRHVVVL